MSKLMNYLLSRPLTRHFYYVAAYIKKGLFLELYKFFSSNLLARFGFLRLPGLFISPSHSCNADCIHCYEKFLHNAFNKSLSTSQIKDVIDQFAKMGGAMVYFCSGEFLIRNDAIELIKYVRSYRMLVSVTTNGILLTEEYINRLKDAGLTDVVVSIDSADPKTHDKYRGVEGCFAKATEGLRLAKAKGIGIHIWTYVTKTNFDELEDIYALSKELGVVEAFIYFPLLSGKLFDKPDENLTFEEREKFRKKYNGRPRFNLEFTAEKDICLGGGRHHMNVMPSGDVTFCPPVPYSYGNIDSKPLKECLKDMRKDFKRFCLSRCTGQCPVNFNEYREECSGKFMYKDV